MTRLLLAALALALLPACASKHRQARKLEGQYAVGEPASGWQRVKPGSADHAWFSSDLSASIYTDSNCGSRYDDRSLEALADSVGFGMVMGEPILQEARSIDGREGLVRTADGRLDGVGFRLGVAVLKKDACVYDLVLVSPPSTFDQAWADFEQVLAGFQAGGG